MAFRCLEITWAIGAKIGWWFDVAGLFHIVFKGRTGVEIGALDLHLTWLTMSSTSPQHDQGVFDLGVMYFC